MKCPINYTKEEILSISAAGGPQLKQMINSILKSLCQCKVFDRTVKSFVKTRGGNDADAEDLIQEGLSQLALNLIDKKYKGQSSVENYAFGICKFKWLNQVSKKGIQTVGITEEDKEEVAPDDVEGSFISTEIKDLLWKVVQTMRGRCPDFLKLWALGYSHKEIGEQLSVTEKRARKNTSECRKRLRGMITEDAHLIGLMKDVQLFKVNLF